MRPYDWTPGRDQIIRDGWRDRIATKNIASKLQLSPGAITARARRIGLGLHPLSNFARRAVREKLLSGMAPSSIALDDVVREKSVRVPEIGFQRRRFDWEPPERA